MIKAFSNFGYEGSLVTVEVDLRRGIPAVDIVGLADGAVKESRERVRSAIRNSGFEFPTERVLIALSPADLRKDGVGFDLPTALAVLAEKEGIKPDDVLVMGELALHGEVRAVRGITAALQTAVEQDIKYAIVPYTEPVNFPRGIKVARVGNLKEAFEVLLSIGSELYYKEYKTESKFNIEFEEVPEEESMDNIKNLDGLKYAMAVAVAGRHNILTYGAPGSGKTLAMQKMSQLMPKLLPDEKTSVDRIYSIAGLSGGNMTKNHIRPFRMPHQTASLEGMCGGGLQCSPGEISLAHNGVLFLDEAAEFRSSNLQMLRVPLESHQITLSRAGRTTVYPARFQLAMATSPCPCGFYGNKDHMCLCSMKTIEMFWRKFSAPLLDRMTIRYNMNEPLEASSWSLEALRSKVKLAWERQYERQEKLNNDLTLEDIAKYISLSVEASEMFNSYVEEENPSARRMANIKKLARTIADMNDTPNADIRFIEKRDMALALALNGANPIEL